MEKHDEGGVGLRQLAGEGLDDEAKILALHPRNMIGLRAIGLRRMDGAERQDEKKNGEQVERQGGTVSERDCKAGRTLTHSATAFHGDAAMPIHIGAAPAWRLSAAELEAWRGIPPAIVSDELNRAGAMDAGIKPLAPGWTVLGHALTVECMAADNGPLHYALTVAWPGAILVADAQGFLGTAVWGSILHGAGEKAGLAGVVIDGAVRDAAELRRSKVPIYARGITPAGPHKGWGGAINGAVTCGGVSVGAGDLVIGDDDGIAVVRPDQFQGLLERCKARMAKEAEMVAKIAAGARTVDLIGLPAADKVGR